MKQVPKLLTLSFTLIQLGATNLLAQTATPDAPTKSPNKVTEKTSEKDAEKSDTTKAKTPTEVENTDPNKAKATTEEKAPAKPKQQEKPKPKSAEKKKIEKKAPKKTVKVFGWKEYIWAVKPDMVLRAKLDTGARTSSIHATNIEEVEIDGKQWVKFTISDPTEEKSIRLRHKAPLVRIGKIKNDTGGLDERFVVNLTFQIGDQKVEGEFNLNDREQMTCPVLIGRNNLMQLGVVDAGRTNLRAKPKKTKSSKKSPKKDSAEKQD